MSELASDSITSTNPKLQRTITRFKSKVANKDYYEAHQTLRSLINRSAKAKQIDHAIDLIYYGSLILVEAEQYPSAADLIFYLIEILTTNEIRSDKEILGKVLTLLTKFPVNELSFKKIDNEIVNWSVKFSDYKFGDPQLHDLLGSKYLNNTSFKVGISSTSSQSVVASEGGSSSKSDELTENYITAQNHLILGTNNSFNKLVELSFNWYLDSQQVANLPQFILFPVANYLILQNVKNAKLFLSSFFKLFYEKFDTSVLEYKNMQVDEFFKIYLFTLENLRILNFIQLTILTIQTKNKDLFLKLKNAYGSDIKTHGLGAAVDKIGAVYFDIQVPKQVNFLQQMMGF